MEMAQSSVALSGSIAMSPQSPRHVSPTSPQRMSPSTSPLRPIAFENAQSPQHGSSSKSFAFPPAPPRVPNPHQRASLTVRSRRSSPLLHEIQGPSRRLSSHQMLLLTPFGGTLPVEAMSDTASSPGRMARASSSMGDTRGDVRSTSFGMAPSYTSVGMGRDIDPSSSAPRALPTLSSRFNARHQSLVQPVNPSPLSQPMTTIQSASEHGSESGSSSRPISREPSNSSSGTGEDGASTTNSAVTSAVPMTRSNSLPVLTQRELDAMTDKDGELGIARGTHWAWVSRGDEDELDEVDSPVPRTTPPARQFAFQDPFAPLGTFAMHASNTSSRYPLPSSTSDEYHYSPTAEPRRMSEATSGWTTTAQTNLSYSPGEDHSRGTSVATITLSEPKSDSSNRSTPPSSTRIFESTSPGHRPAQPAFNSRASMSAIEAEHDPYVQLAAPDAYAAGGGSTLTRPRILRYKTSPARFTGLGLDIVVKATQPDSGHPQGRPSISGPSGPPVTSLNPGRRRRSSQLSSEHEQERRRSSGTSASSTGSQGQGQGRKGTWAVVDVVESLSLSTLSTNTDSSLPSLPSTSASYLSLAQQATTRSSMPIANTIFTVEHVSSRSTSISISAVKGKDKFGSIPSKKGKMAFGYDTISPLLGDHGSVDPLAFPRRGSLAVLSQTALGPWASKAAVQGDEELLGAPKGNWQDRRGSWAEGWSRK